MTSLTQLIEKLKAEFPQHYYRLTSTESWESGLGQQPASLFQGESRIGR